MGIEETTEKLKMQLKEITAEYRNFRKRTKKEKEELRQTGCESLLESILPSIDDMERSLGHSDEDPEAFKRGIFLSYVKLIKALQTQGVEIMNTQDQDFNPDFHEAVGVTESGESGKVINCVKHGYLLNGKIVRHAQVIVSK